ncbi:MAG: HlyD family efflux transporter periplasmic adaptor subunit [Proteobacteria bacterium]|nr:HlyD family efflux transporter periplasmic adaptor subunit [Pseudomonadota bacterium]
MNPLPRDGASVSAIRGTAATDRPVDPAPAARRRRRRLTVAALAALGLVALAVPALRALTRGEHAVPAAQLRVATVVRGRFVSEVSAQGTVVAALSPTLVAPAAGSVAYRVRAGEPVRRGQLLAVVDSPELRNEYAKEHASLESLEATLARETIEIRRKSLANREAFDVAGVALRAAEREFARAEGAYAQHVMSQRDHDKASDELDAARIRHRHATASAALEEDSLALELKTRRLERDRQRLVCDELKRRVAELELRAPVDGVVGTLAVAEQASVAARAAVVTVVDPSVYEVEFTAPDVYAGTLRPGMAAEVTLGADSAPATVVALSPEVRQGQLVGRARFQGAQPTSLSQNQRVAVRVVVEARDGVLKVERGAFVDSGGGRVAYRLDGDLAERVAVHLGSSSASEVEILDGLAAGDRIVVSSLAAFENAPRVRLIH